MPLNWIYSGLMMVVLLLMVCVVYSYMNSEVEYQIISIKNMKNPWFW